MDLLVPGVISLISKLGAMMVLIKAAFMSLCHSLEERMALWQPANDVTMTCTGGIGHTLSSCLLGCGIQDEAEVCVCCVARSAPPLQLVMSVRSTVVLNVLTPTLLGPMLFVKYNRPDSWSC